MIRLKVTDRDKIPNEITAPPEGSLMEVLRDHDLGVAAICGGMASCATCHVYVEAAWAEKLAPMPEEEAELIAELGGRQATSRLSCQIALTPALDGLEVSIAPEE